MKIFKAKQARNLATLIVVGAGLLLVLSACENSKHAEITSTEDLLARTHMATAPDIETETETVSDQSGMAFEARAIDPELLGLAEPLVFDPELPPSPTLSPGDEIESGPGGSSVDEPAKEVVQPKAPAPAEGPVAEPEVASVSDGTVPTEGSVAEPEAVPVSEETISAEETSAEPEMEIAKLEPSDFVPVAPGPEPEGRRVETGIELELADVFFDFDQFAIRSAAVPVLEKNAELLKQTYKNASVLIEGHCDERGTGEYNLELGKRRAQAVKEYLVDLGIEENRLHIASYGKERPFCSESTPSCWQNNRRGHFVRRVLQTSLSK